MVSKNKCCFVRKYEKESKKELPCKKKPMVIQNSYMSAYASKATVYTTKNKTKRRPPYLKRFNNPRFAFLKPASF